MPKSPRKSASQSARGKKKAGAVISNNVRAGTTFPVGRLTSLIRRSGAPRTSITAGAFMAAILDYICTEIFEQASVACE